MGPVARLDAARLVLGDAGQDGGGTRGEVPRKGWRQIVQGPREQIGQDEVGLHAPEIRVSEAFPRDHADRRPRAIGARIGGGDAHGYRVMIAGEHRSLGRVGRGDGQDAAARAEIEDASWRLSLEHIVERDQAAAR